ncbi:MAG: hypothetical protein KGL39_41745 [Patescibacteria group bacterium]|nr:hypothetical protein [Patescibacteria group bacterium]
MPSTALQLGDFVFADAEIPGTITGGGTQSLTVHRLVGGTKIVDAMGRDDHDLSWGGFLYGQDALARCQQLDYLRVSGQQIALTFGGLSYLVAVKSFEYDYRYQYDIPYRISCEVVQDQTKPITSNATPAIDDQMASDLSATQTYVGDVGDPTLSSLTATLTASMGGVATFSFATASTVSSVLQPLSAVQGRVSALISINESSLSGASGFAGVVAGGQPIAMAAELESQDSTCATQVSLLQLQGILGRMSANLSAINGSPNTVTTAGGNLFQIAVEQYDDAMAWTGIATANGLTDPFVQGTETLNIPLQPANSDGVLQA